MRCINLIQGCIGSPGNKASKTEGSTANRLPNMEVDASPSGDECCADINTSYISNNSIDLCSPDRIELPNGWEAPAPPVQPVLQPLRLYLPELEEIRISPIVARKGNLFTNLTCIIVSVFRNYLT